MPQRQLVAFDWDQTLWNSWRLHKESIQYAADNLGLARPSTQTIVKEISSSVDGHINRLFSASGTQIMDMYLEFYRNNVHELAHPFHGISSILSMLQDHGHRLAIVSDKPTEFGEKELTISGLQEYFDSVVFRAATQPTKPNPQGLRQVLSNLGVPPNQTIYIGDSIVDIDCARNTGVLSGAALWGSLNTAETLRKTPDYAWETVEQLAATVGTRSAPFNNTETL